MILPSDPCPCFSKKAYQDCCLPYHKGSLPENGLQLMRSRYSAYAIGLTAYIMKTTHPQHPDFAKEQSIWEKEIAHFCHTTRFVDLEILEHIEKEKESFVTFKALLQTHGKDVSFIEKSKFEKLQGHILYREAIFIHKNAFVR